MKNKKRILSIALIIILAIIGVGCGKKDTNKIKIGVVGERNEAWEYIISELKKENIEAELVTFTDYNQPNKALLEGDLDLNSFQHYLFLEKFNNETGNKLEPIGNTMIAPLGIYSKKIKSLDELKEGDNVAIPNDVSNRGRALLLLQEAGLIKVDPDAALIAGVDDITENPKKLKISELNASQTARSLDDVTISIINNGMAIEAGLDISSAVFLEPISEASKPYINVIVARKEEIDNEVYKKIVKIYQTDEVEKIIIESSKGGQVKAW